MFGVNMIWLYKGMNIIKIGMRYLYFGKGKGMNIKECYALMEADYEGAIECLLTEERLLKFYKMFIF